MYISLQLEKQFQDIFITEGILYTFNRSWNDSFLTKAIVHPGRDASDMYEFD